MPDIEPTITPSAYKHGLSRRVILHAWANIIAHQPGRPGLMMDIGLDPNGTPIELGCQDNDRIIHAMKARKEFLPEKPPHEPTRKTRRIMPRSLNDVLEHADELVKQFEDFEPTGELVSGDGLRLIRQAVIANAETERQIVAAVVVARGEGFSWDAIGPMFGMSGEATRLRYAAKCSELTD